MATNDGFAPYPIGLTALEVKTAINRAFNLSTELQGYVGIQSNATAPTIAGGVKTGDVWEDISNAKFYNARIDATDPQNPVLVYFEV